MRSKSFEVDLCTVARWHHGQIVEENLFYDVVGLMAQLGTEMQLRQWAPMVRADFRSRGAVQVWRINATSTRFACRREWFKGITARSLANDCPTFAIGSSAFAATVLRAVA